jgi:hypothetical protein
MTTRRHVLRLAAGVPAAATAAALTGCVPSRTPAAPTGGTVPRGTGELLLIRTSAGLTLIDTATGAAQSAPRTGVSACDLSAVATTRDAGSTTVVSVDSPHGFRYETTVAAGLVPRAVSPGGRFVALANDAGSVDSTTYKPVGRAETTIVVASRDGARPALVLPGCVEPEAFSSAGDRLFVLDYLPPSAPDRYRVRVVDLTTGAYGALITRDKKVIPPGAEEEMRGEGRQAVLAPGRQLLFTLYTHQPDHEHTRDLIAGQSGARADKPDVHAFVHTLSTEMGFAYCVDLPAPFGEAAPAAHAIALAPSSQIPYVIDAAHGVIVSIDPDQLVLLSTATVNLGADRASATGATFATFAPSGETLYLSTGAAVLGVKTRGMTMRSRWAVPAPVRGLAITADGGRLWVGQPDGLAALDTATGSLVARLPIPGLTQLVGDVGR